jgi:uncharacterized membrane protein
MHASSADRPHPAAARAVIAFIRAVPWLFAIAMCALTAALLVAGTVAEAAAASVAALLASSVAFRVSALERR